jgi:precorrin-2 dehydrogenase/sirohydrochlorin ferrochelatase
MLPVMLDLSRRPVLLYGHGPAALKRLGLLKSAGARDLRVFSPDEQVKAEAGPAWRAEKPAPADIRAALAVFIANAPDAEAVAAEARAGGVLVNVEDVTSLCDFYTPGVVRRGDLVLAVSTSGRAPGLARRLRRKLEDLFGPEWADRVAKMAAAREGWRRDGADSREVARRSDELVDREGWL